MNFAIAICVSIKCYQNNAKLIGNSQLKQFELILTPSSVNKFCVAGDNEPSTVDLIYMNGSATSSLTQSYVHSATQINRITFDLSADSAKYDFIQKQTKLSYDAKIISQLSSKSSVSVIQHTQMNTTNCWNDLSLVIDLAANEMTISGQPLDCVVTIVDSVQIQYSDDKQYEFTVVGKDAPGYYYNGAAFVFKDFQHYYLAKSQLTVEQAAYYEKMIAQILLGKLPEFRLVISTHISGVTLNQNIVGQVEKVALQQSDCLAKLGLFGSINPTDIMIGVDFSNYAAHCQPAQQFNSYMLYKLYGDSQNKSQVTEIVSFDGSTVQHQYGFRFELPERIDPRSYVKVEAHLYFLAFDLAGNLIFTDFAELELRRSCILSSQAMISQARACTWIDQQSNCAVDLLNLYITDADFKSYGAFQVGPNQCSLKKIEQRYGQVSDSYADIKRQIKKSVGLRIVLRNADEFVTVGNVTLLDDRKWLYGFLGLAVATLAIVVTLLILSQRKFKSKRRRV